MTAAPTMPALANDAQRGSHCGCGGLLAIGEPFFKTPEEYEAFRERWHAEVWPELEKQRRARAASEREAMNRYL